MHFNGIFYLKKETKADPLIVSVNFAVVCLALTISDARIRHLLAKLFQEHAFESVCAVYPAICVENVLRNIFCVNAIDRIADILTCGDDQREGNQHHDGD